MLHLSNLSHSVVVVVVVVVVVDVVVGDGRRQI